jgi:OOP family OmpA-OmpF porin
MSCRRHLHLAALAAFLSLAAGPLVAAPGDMPVPPQPHSQRASADAPQQRIASLPARGLFVGDKLSESARARLTDLVLNALGLRVEVALLVPVGPWQIDDSGHDERDLTPARLQALRHFLTERGVSPKRIFVESRIDARVSEPRLEVQLVGGQADD